MRKRFISYPVLQAIVFVIFSGWIGWFATVRAEEKKHDPVIWREAIEAFEKQDRDSPPEPNGILFLGSSSIRIWDVKKSFPDVKALNRGFGGSHIEDSVYYFDSLVLPYRPRTIVFYAGDNDIASGKSVERVIEDFIQFRSLVQQHFPETRLIYIGIKPSIARWKWMNDMQKVNRSIQAMAEKDERLDFVDIYKPMLDEKGEPNAELFQKDGLHLNDKGYELWTKLIAPQLKSTH